MNETLPKKCHFIGIGGIGMSALARLLLKQKVKVSGSDLKLSYTTEDLAKSGASLFEGHHAKNIESDMTIIFSSDIPETNEELKAAIALKCPMMHRSELLQKLMATKKTLTVAGTHGKTTTTALLASVLKEASFSPSFMVGGMVEQWKTNAEHGEGDYFVAEADESDGTFLNYSPFGSIVTNIGLDHLNHFKTEENLIKSFIQYMKQVTSKQHLFWCGDDARLREINPIGYSYGFGPHVALRGENFRQEGWKTFFDVTFERNIYRDVELNLTGRHNALNALAVFGLSLSLGIPERDIRRAFKQFKGTGRRQERKGEKQGVLFVDDYAHHPTEIEATLRAVRQAVQERRMIVIYQPHRYSRIRYMLGQFKGVFQEADQVIITDIFAASEAPVEGVTGIAVAKEVALDHQHTRHIPKEELIEKLLPELRPHDVVLTLGAGDITKWGDLFLEALDTYPIKKWSLALIKGGENGEHEVSLQSAKHIRESLRPDFYQVKEITISKEGNWFIDQPEKELFPPAVSSLLQEVDVVFPILHGPKGEDGTLQGMLEIFHKPYVGMGHTASAISMDKAFTKQLCEKAGLLTSPYIVFEEGEWKKDAQAIVKKVEEKLSYPVFVKGVHLGSSVGTTKVESQDQLEQGILEALKHDTKILIENGIIGREIEFAVLGNDPITVFSPGEVLTGGKVYDYEAKYGANGFSTTIHPELSQEAIEKGKRAAATAFRAVGGKGFARVDFFLDREGKFWLNEINPIPGFTKISLYPQICYREGMSPQELMDRLVTLALQRGREVKQ